MAVTVTGRESEKYKFTAPAFDLVPGRNTLRLFCSVSSFCSSQGETCSESTQAVVMGKYLIQSTEIRVGNLVFHWDHRRTHAKSSTSSKRSNAIIRVPQDIHALDVTVDQSTRSRCSCCFLNQSLMFKPVELGKPPTILVTVSTGRNNPDRLKLRLVCPNTTWRYTEAHTEGMFRSLNPCGILA